MNDALYFPIHRAKKGQIDGVGRLSPASRTRVRATFEIQPSSIDLFLDFETLAMLPADSRSAPAIVATMTDALRKVARPDFGMW